MQEGDKVFRKGHSLQWGIVRSIYTVRDRWGMRPAEPTHAWVDWHAPNRIGGRGYHRSALKITAIVLATEDEATRRRAWLDAKREQQKETTHGE